MTAIVSLFNTCWTYAFGLIYGALRWMGPFWSLVAISFLGGIFMVWLFGKVSNQDAIKRTRNRLSAELIALKLFKDDLRVFFRIQGQILIWTLKYLRHSLIPMIIIMLPVLAILIQLNLHYAMRPLGVGEHTLVKMKVRDVASLSPDVPIEIIGGDGLAVETAGVRAPALREVSWRVRGEAPGRADLVLQVGEESVRKSIAVGGRLEGVSSLRTGENWLANLLYPGESPIPPDSAVESVEILYPALDITFLGWGMNWLILFFVLSMVFGFSFKGVLGVQI